MSTVDRILRRLDTPDDIAARERRRIRRLIAPHLYELKATYAEYPITTDMLNAIDAATRAPKKGRAK